MANDHHHLCCVIAIEPSRHAAASSDMLRVFMWQRSCFKLLTATNRQGSRLRDGEQNNNNLSFSSSPLPPEYSAVHATWGGGTMNSVMLQKIRDANLHSFNRAGTACSTKLRKRPFQSTKAVANPPKIMDILKYIFNEKGEAVCT